MELIRDYYDFDRFLDTHTEDFAEAQSVAMGFASYLRGYMQWPKIRKDYEDFKVFFGKQSMINHRIQNSAFKNLNRKELPEMYLAYYLLQGLYEAQTNEYTQVTAMCRYRLRTLFQERKKISTIPLTVINDILNDSVNWQPKKVVAPTFKLHREVQNMLSILNKEEKYKELPVFADMLEDFHGDALIEFAEHFRSGVHTYSCKYLRALRLAK
jgi:hypothetical protein